VAWHDGETCAQYDARRTDAQKEYDASEELKVKVSSVPNMRRAYREEWRV
jgi:hypothetical protein